MCYTYLIPRKIIEKLENFRFFEAICPVRIRLENSGCLMPSPDQAYHKQSGSDFGIWDMAFSSTFRGPALDPALPRQFTSHASHTPYVS